MSQSRTEKDCITFTGTAGHETARAIEFTVLGDHTQDGESKSCWFPFSQVEVITRDPLNSRNDKITVSRWIAQQKELVVE